MNETRRLYRSETEKVIAGVCGGVGEYFNVDPTIVRLGFAVATLAGGLGPVLYLIMWIVVPRRSRLDLPPNETAREAVEEVKQQAERGVQEARSAYERWRSKPAGSEPDAAPEAGGQPDAGPGGPEVQPDAGPAGPEERPGGPPGEEPPGDRL